MDFVDAPYQSMKQRRERPKDSFQSELRQKMQDRKKMGLTADITSEESEGFDEGLDSDEENSMTMNYRMQHKRTDRPTSAKRRGKSELGETMRASDANKWLKSTQSKKDSMSTLRETPPLKESPRFSKQTSRSEIDQMFGASPRSQTSPLDKKLLRQSPVEGGGLFSKGRTSPSQSGSGTSLPKSLFGGKQSPVSREMTNEEKIFGRKTPTNESQLPQQEKEWKAPSFKQRSPYGDQERTSPSAELDKRGGRKTPVDSSLQPITESPRPVPRSRQGYSTSPKEQRLKSRDSSPRSLSLESPRSERPKPKVDIFGRKEKHVELDDEPEKLPSTRERRRFQREDKKALPGQRSTTGRLTPTGRKTPTGRETPTGRSKSPTGRQTPTGKHTKFDLKGEKGKEETKTKKEPSLFDFLADDAPTDKPKPKSRSAHDRSMDRKPQSLKKSVSHDSITEEFNAHSEQPSMFESSNRDEPSRKIPSDQSSVCMDLDRDPDKENERMKEREKRYISKNQRSDRKEADDIISRVEDAQSDPKQITKERPASAKTNDKVLRPKPRHSLPGSRPSSAATEYSMETFNSTMSIRQAIFDEWKKAKTIEMKQKTLEQKKKEEEEKKKKEKEAQDKKLESLASYNAWMKQKGETYVKDKHKEKREEEKKQKEKEREELLKKKEALKDFNKWKEVKDEKLIDEHKKKVEEKHREQQQERMEKKEKEKQNETAFRGWKVKKDEKIKDNIHQQHEEKLKTQKVMMKTQKQKEQGAMKEYNEWLKKKEKQNEIEAMKKRRHNDEFYEDYKPAWSPASKLIPCGR